MRITTDTGVCIGSGQCALALPEVFEQDDAGVVVVLDRRPPDVLHEQVRQVVSQCPVQAITAATD